VAVLRDAAVLGVVAHEKAEDYSSWLLPAVNEVLGRSGIRMDEVDGYAAAAGPGSFTGVRVALTAVKAWAEVYGKPIAAVSRLESLAAEAPEEVRWVAAFFNAQREQVFGAIFHRDGGRLARSGDEMVIAPEKFVETAAESAGDQGICWVSMDPECLVSHLAWKARESRNEKVTRVASVRAPMIGLLGWAALREGRFTDALALDANYVRRSDAEVFWKGSAAHGR
jgi:tRNA threonylcarbamoyladenosine biosynthesis protein TsaB